MTTEIKNTTRGMRKTKTGVVTSNKMDKSVVVSVQKRVQHPIYKKYIVHRNKFVAHDEKNACAIGDTVQIVETRPLSRSKRWRVVNIIKTSQEKTA